jgi:hypothetical protein
LPLRLHGAAPPTEGEVKGFTTVYRLTFEATEDADGIPPAIRLRHTLKRALRSDHLRCRRAEQLGIMGGWAAVDDSHDLTNGEGI